MVTRYQHRQIILHDVCWLTMRNALQSRKRYVVVVYLYMIWKLLCIFEQSMGTPAAKYSNIFNGKLCLNTKISGK